MSSSDSVSVQVNFGRPIPLFPLHNVTLLPQQVVPLHIFEERYRQLVGRAVDVGVLVLVEVRQPVDDRLRLLCRCRVVEPDQGTAVDRFLQNREIAADRMHIECGMRGAERRRM